MELENMKNIAARIVERDDIRYLIGWKEGTYGYRIAPAFIDKPEEAEKLTFSPLCTANLVTYLTLFEKKPLPRGEQADQRKVAIMVKGCDSRALVQLIVEKGISRDQVVIIGCPCRGVVDLHKLSAIIPESNMPVALNWTEKGFLIKKGGETIEVLRNEIIAEKCLLCRYPNPVIFDVNIGEFIEPLPACNDRGVNEVEIKSIEERAKYWEEQFSNCIRCYSCRNVCPLCYCQDCILDRLNPTWINRSVNYSENTSFNIARAFHLAGRCIECGECERVCPARIPLGRLNRKIAKDIREKYGFEPGLDPEAEPFQASFKPDDPDNFIL